MNVVPNTSENWRTYQSWFAENKVVPPAIIPQQCIMVADDDGTLLGGICIYVTDGMWMFLDHFQIKPGLSVGKIRQVSRLGLKAAQGYGKIISKVPMIISTRDATAHLLERAGYIEAPGTVWVGPLVPQVKKDPPEGSGKNLREVEREEDNESDSTIDHPETKSKSVAVCSICELSFVRTGDETMCADCTANEAAERSMLAAKEGKKKPAKKPGKKVSARRKKNANAVDKGPPPGDE